MAYFFGNVNKNNMETEEVPDTQDKRESGENEERDVENDENNSSTVTKEDPPANNSASSGDPPTQEPQGPAKTGTPVVAKPKREAYRKRDGGRGSTRNRKQHVHFEMDPLPKKMKKNSSKNRKPSRKSSVKPKKVPAGISKRAPSRKFLCTCTKRMAPK